MNLLIIPALAVGAFVAMGVWSQKGEAPGLTDEGRLQDPGTKPNCVCSEPGTQPERAVAPLDASLDAAAAVIETLGGTITSRTDSYLSATFMSKLFKFVDDVEIRQAGSICHIRSASRVGYSDNGVNRKRVAAIRAAL